MDLPLGVGLPVFVRLRLLGVGSGGRRDGGSGRRSFLVGLRPGIVSPCQLVDRLLDLDASDEATSGALTGGADTGGAATA